MKRILPLLLVAMLVAAIPMTALAQQSISEELKRILHDPNTPKSAGLPQQLVQTQGKTKAEKTIKDLGPQAIYSSPDNPMPGPIWPPYPWLNTDQTSTTYPWWWSTYNSPTGGAVSGYWWNNTWYPSNWPYTGSTNFNWASYFSVDPKVTSTVYASLEAALTSVQNSNKNGSFPMFYYFTGYNLFRGVYGSGVYNVYKYDGAGSWNFYSSYAPYA